MARPRGRPSGCTPERIDQARRLARLGLTEAELAEFWGVGPSTVTSWKTAHPEFLAALKDGEIAADACVAESLYRRAVGYAHEAEEIKVINGEVVRVKTTKHYAPDVTACIFWLKNRQRATWRDRPEPEPPPAPDFREMLRREAAAYRLFAQHPDEER